MWIDYEFQCRFRIGRSGNGFCFQKFDSGKICINTIFKYRVSTHFCLWRHREKSAKIEMQGRKKWNLTNQETEIFRWFSEKAGWRESSRNQSFPEEWSLCPGSNSSMMERATGSSEWEKPWRLTGNTLRIASLQPSYALSEQYSRTQTSASANDQDRDTLTADFMADFRRSRMFFIFSAHHPGYDVVRFLKSSIFSSSGACITLDDKSWIKKAQGCNHLITTFAGKDSWDYVYKSYSFVMKIKKVL